MSTSWLKARKMTALGAGLVLPVAGLAALSVLLLARLWADAPLQAVVQGTVAVAALALVSLFLAMWRRERKNPYRLYLEKQVEERTASLTAVNDQLRKEVSERRQAEEKLRNAHRALETLSRCNRALVRAREEAELLEEICKVVVDKGRYRLAWVGFAEEGPARRVRPVAQAGFANGYLETLDIRWDDSERGRGPTGTAIRSGLPCFASDTPDDPALEPWLEEAGGGYSSAIALPLKNGTRPFGALNVYSDEPGAFGPGEVQLLEELAADLAFGIVAIRTRAERQRAEESLRLAHQRLQGAYDHLERARAAASTSEKLAALGRLTAGVSHEILNPLSGIIMNLHYLQGHSRTPEWIAEELKDMSEQANRITKIAQGLLFFARRRTPERKLIDLNETVNRTLGLLEHDLKLTNIRVELALAERLPKVLADQDQLQQVVLNLLTNARDVMPKGGRLTLETAEVPATSGPDGKAIEFRVRDTGPGIDPEHRDKLFDPFFTTKPEGEGTGLGLSICQGIVETHGGSIWAEDAPDGGAVFVVRLSAEEA